ncbi:AraC family transcriptional regulator [Marinobacterium sp. D7]|uniref:AraC family transcriptional regulator n=1 Tax=Marinobacterium ramblicola TaxID=2849041 RepID=UPI001C2CDE1B|nr:AraC family transcriptional regulator [Marinobacterium ramblicola]MBV1789042.1 AraC family transcriptional regulator [Marinobacterium ramblicola]
MAASTQGNWAHFSRDADTGIELLRTHFTGHTQAYDPHWHDDYLIGYNEQGFQQFHCRHQVQQLTPGNSFLLEPGEIHDGEAPHPEGFTYRALYLPAHWLHQQLRGIFEDLPDRYELHVESTLSEDRLLMGSIASAYIALREQEPRIVRSACLDQMIERMTAHLSWRKQQAHELLLPHLAREGRDYLHAHLYQDIGLEEMATALGSDRFRVNRAFKAAFGVAPHTYLIQLRLVQARQLLANGRKPAEVASLLCFSDQSHLGRWFRRAYNLTPAAYRSFCTSVPD